ncbi:MAG: T9SS type A sorting domain-containing protein [Candidatus Hatepunaea meridiana]|nr:T9SS type A sorting domain-containing protein [Candidatus Hatepunaea meridiana]
MKNKSIMIPFILLILMHCASICQAEIIEETGSLLEFFAGNEERCEYDNWVSHISEGIAREGYNDYGPAELDRQTNGFGAYQIVDSLDNPEGVLEDWYNIFANVLAGNIDEALVILEESDFADVYQMVLLEDEDKNYLILREVLNNDYADDNGTEGEADDVTGSFDYGWGLYVFNLDPGTPNVVLEMPHPCDDYITPFIGIDAFLLMDALAMFVSGSGREVEWTEEGNYSNSKARSDPTRTQNVTPFQEAHKAVVDSVDNEFVMQIHSYDTGGRDLSQCLMSTSDDNYPNPPVFDAVYRFDILHLTPFVPIPSNSIGNADHDSVRIDKYYAIWNSGSRISYYDDIYIPDDMPGLQGWYSPQMYYSHEEHDERQDDENWFHVEHDEFPDVINEDILDFYPAEGVPTYETYTNAVDYYRPLYTAINDYYHNSRFFIIPENYETIQTAIDASYGGDTLIVHPGRYSENINFSGKNLNLASLFLTTGDPAYIDSTIIDGDQNGSVVTFCNSESDKATLSGFTLTNGNSSDGAGIFCNQTDPIISHCVITGNSATGAGGSVFCESAEPEFINCTISENSADDWGGAVFCWDGSSPVFTNCIIWDNPPHEINFLRFGNPNEITCSYSDIAGGQEGIVINDNGQVNWGYGSIDQDPIFTDPLNGNFHLWAGSPCIDAGDTLSPLDQDSTWIEMGAFPYHHRYLEVIPNIIEFIGIAPGVTDSLPVTIRNVGQEELTITAQTIIPDDSPFTVGMGGGEVELEPESSHITWICFTPEEADRYEADLRIESDEPNEGAINVILRGSTLGIKPDDSILPDDFAIRDIYPNPFNASTNISYSIPAPAHVRIRVYNVTGQLIETIVAADCQPGNHSVVFNADRLASGMYFVTVEAYGKALIRKVVLIR